MAEEQKHEPVPPASDTISSSIDATTTNTTTTTDTTNTNTTDTTSSYYSPQSLDLLNANSDDEGSHEFNLKTVRQRLAILFSNQHYKRALPFIILWVIAGYIPAVFFSPWGAEQFSDCVNHTADEQDSNACEIDYNSYNKTASIFSSLAGLVAFLFGGVVGRISDSFGRKPIFYMNIILSAGMYAPLAIWPTVWIKWIMQIPAGLNDNDNSFTPMMVAYMSDIMPTHQRTLAYSVTYAFCALGLFVGVGLAITLGIFFGDESNFIAIAIIDVLQLIYCYFMVPESLKVQNRKPFTAVNLNPLRPLYHCCCYHPIVLWIAVVQFFISLPETGVLDMSIIYILDQLNIQNESDANITNGIFIVSCSVGLLLGPLLILPKLQGCNASNIQILCVGIGLFFSAFLMFSLLAFVKSMVVAVIGGILITSGFISFPAANGIVTKYLTKNEQGIGFGVIFATRALTWIIAPISFAETYSFFKGLGIPAMTMLSAGCMILIALVIVLWPLKKNIEEAQRTGRTFTFSSMELEMMDRSQMNGDHTDAVTTDSNAKLEEADKKKKQKDMDTMDRFETLDPQSVDIR